MDNKQPIRQIDPDVLQCKADILRARQSGIIKPAEINSESDKHPEESQQAKSLPYALRPLDHKNAEPIVQKQNNVNVPPALRPLGGQILWPKDSGASDKFDLPITIKPFLDVKIEQPGESEPEVSPVDKEDNEKTASEIPSPGDADEQEQEKEAKKSDVPRFNLAEQILKAQRTAVSNRRQKTMNTPFKPDSSPKGIQQVFETITNKIPPVPIREISPPPTSDSKQPVRKASFSMSNDLGGPEHDLIAKIVAQDIKHFCSQ